MSPPFDETAVRAAFAQPGNDGAFPGAFADYLQELSRRRPAVIFAFPPKAAGTFLRTAAITAIDGQLIRVVHAQGGRDAQPYLPLFISYYLGGMGTKKLVTHVHMQALPANCRFVEALDLKPVAMLRSIPDMLASYWDMLDSDEAATREGLNCQIPPGFPTIARARQADFLVDILGPWYAGYYATWLGYAGQNPDRVCLLRYGEFLSAPDAALEKALAHAGVARSREVCRAAVEAAWQERHGLRFNRGERGRGRNYFSWRHIARIGQMLSYYPALDEVADELLA